MGLFNNDRLIIGYDLGNEICQISYAFSETGEAETLSQVAGAQSYNIPAVLCKRTGVNQWYYGKDALRYAQEDQGILVDNLFGQALAGEQVIIEGEAFDPVALLALFFRRSLGLLTQVASSERIGALMITCEMVDGRVLEVLNGMLAAVHLKTDRVAIQSHTESYYNYMLRQPEELWTNRSVLLDYRSSCVRVYRMECNRRTTPVVVFIDESVHPFYAWEPLPEEETAREKRMQELDGSLLQIAQNAMSSQVESVYLIGDGFEQEWMKESLRFLCKGRRVFQGNNLFSKGACCSMQERLSQSRSAKEYVFLGRDKLKANIGMQVLRQGEESYYALLDAGMNWYEADAAVEFYIRDGSELALLVTPLTGKSGKETRIVLEDFPGSVARLRARFYLEAENLLVIEVQDLGFGEFRSSSRRVWKERIELYQVPAQL